MLSELFDEVNCGNWITAGEDVQYKVVNRVLYFQCSHGARDWLYNFDIAESVYPCSDVPFVMHGGFNLLWQSIRHDIEKLDFDTIVGYSQGAALAIMAHENFYHRKGYEPLAFTFGCPASIFLPSKQLRKRFTKVVNIINPRDIVYYSTLIFGYRHVGATQKLEKVKIKTSSFRQWLREITHHTPERYKLALKGL